MITFDNEIMNYLKNCDILDNGVHRFRTEKRYKYIRMKCFNKKEALEMEEYAKWKYPDVPIYFAWNVWIDPKTGEEYEGEA